MKRRWTPEKVKAMRRELLEGGLTLKQVAERERVSVQQISKVVGRLDRSTAAERHKQVRLFVEAGKSDDEIAMTVGLSAQYVSLIRRRSGVSRPRGRRPDWTQEKIIEKARLWYEFYGSLSASDWQPPRRMRISRPEMVNRFQDFGAPHVTTVIKRFGSWSEMLRQADLPVARVSRQAPRNPSRRASA
jgi:Homing endonuclease associated repeat